MFLALCSVTILTKPVRRDDHVNDDNKDIHNHTFTILIIITGFAWLLYREPLYCCKDAQYRIVNSYDQTCKMDIEYLRGGCHSRYEQIE